MAEVVKVEVWAVYRYKLAAKYCLQLATLAKGVTTKLDLDSDAFGHVSNGKAMRKAWESAVEARQKEAAALEQELEDLHTALGDVLELYGYTDQELSKRIRDATGDNPRHEPAPEPR